MIIARYFQEIAEQVKPECAQPVSRNAEYTYGDHSRRERKTSREERPNWDVGSPLTHVRVQCEYMRVTLGSPLTQRAIVQRLLMVSSAAFLVLLV